MNAVRKLLVVGAALGLFAGGASAVLQDRDLDGDGEVDAVYDTVLNITWLRNWNAAAGTPYDNGASGADGRMTWASAKAWAAGLSLGGYDDWRLPSMIDTGSAGCTFSHGGGTESEGFDCGYNVLTKSGDPLQRGADDVVYSEMAHLYYETLDNGGACLPSPLSSIATCTGNPDWSYDSQARFAAAHGGLRPFLNVEPYHYWSGVEYMPGTGSAWGFYVGDGGQFAFGAAELYAVAVRSGDVLTSVTEPPAILLAIGAFAGMGLSQRRRAVNRLGGQAHGGR